MLASSLIILAIVLAIIVFNKTNQGKKYPPGPSSWLPFIGHRLLTKRLTKKIGCLEGALAYLAKQYKTNVLGMNISGNYTVIVFGEKINRRVFLGKEFQARPQNYFNTLRSMGTNKGITMTDGQLWHVQRTFLVKQLSELGFGGKIMDDLIDSEFNNFKNDLGEGGAKVDISYMLNYRTVNVLWHLVAGQRFSGNDPTARLIKLMKQRSKAFDIAGGNLSHMPWLRFIAPESSGFNLILDINKQLHKVVQDTIDQHKKTYDENVTRDFIDAFLHEMFQNEENSTFTDDQLMMMCLDLFIAGSQTTSHTLEFCILWMINRPDIQEKLQKELDTVFSPNEIPSYHQRQKLPYANAVITEIMRVSHVISLFGPRRVLWDTELDGYHIPKGSTIIMHMTSVQKNPDRWNNPDEVIPERFLNEVDEDLSYFPFSLGKRRCPGEVMARSFIFVFFCGLFHFFKVEPVSGEPVPPTDSVPGLTNTPRPYSAKITRRHPIKAA